MASEIDGSIKLGISASVDVKDIDSELNGLKKHMEGIASAFGQSFDKSSNSVDGTSSSVRNLLGTLQDVQKESKKAADALGYVETPSSKKTPVSANAYLTLEPLVGAEEAQKQAEAYTKISHEAGSAAAQAFLDSYINGLKNTPVENPVIEGSIQALYKELGELSARMSAMKAQKIQLSDDEIVATSARIAEINTRLKELLHPLDIVAQSKKDAKELRIEMTSLAQSTADNATALDKTSASVETLYQQYKNLTNVIAQVKKGMLASGMSEAAIAKDKAYQSLSDAQSSIGKEIRHRGFNPTSDYAPAVNIAGNETEQQAKQIAGITSAIEQLESEIQGLSSADTKVQPLVDRLAMLKSLLESLTASDVKVDPVADDAVSNVKALTDAEKEALHRHAEWDSVRPDPQTEVAIYEKLGNEAGNAFMAQFRQIVMTQGKEAGLAFLRDSGFASGMSSLAQSATPVDVALKELLDKYNELNAVMKEYNKSGVGFANMDDAKGASIVLADLKRRVDEYKQAVADAGKEPADAPAKGLGHLIARYNELNARVREFKRTGLGMDDSQFASATVRLQKMKSQIDATQKKLAVPKGFEGLIVKFQQLSEKIKSTDKHTKTFGSTVSRVFKGLIAMVKGAIFVFKKLKNFSRKSATGMGKDFKHSIMNILKLTLGVRGLFTIIRRLRTAVKQAFEEMAKQVPSVNTVMSEFVTSMNGVKGAIGTAFSPIAEVVLPLLSRLCNMLQVAMTALGQFFGVLTGNKVYKYTAEQVDYAESLDSTSKSAKDAKKALMGFDELNVLPGNDGGASGAESKGTYEEIEPTDAIKSFADKVKQAFGTGDGFDIGSMIAEKLQGGFDKLNAFLTGGALTTAQNGASAIATMINGFASNGDLAVSAGKSLGNGLNLITTTLNTFFTTTNFARVGNSLAELANSALETTDFNELGETIGGKIRAGLNLFYGFVDDFNFEKLGDSLSETINGLLDKMNDIDPTTGLSGWQTLGKNISKSIKGIVKALSTAIKNIKWDDVGSAIGDMISSIDWAGVAWDFAKLVGAMVSGIAEAIVGWAETSPISAAIASLIGIAVIGTKVIPAVSGIISLFQGTVIPVISKVISVIGGVVSAIGGVASAVIAIVAVIIAVIIKFNDEILGFLETAYNWVHDFFTNIGNIVSGFFDGIIEKVSEFSPALGAILTAIKTVVMTVIYAIQGAIELIINVVSDVVKLIGAIAHGEWKEAWEAFKKIFTDVWGAIWGFLKKIINTIIGGINGMIRGICKGINAVIGLLNKLSFDIPDWVPGLGGKKFGFNLKELTAPQIPLLAQGAVLPPNNPFLAMVGDQKSGTNIEAPLSTIQEAVAEEMSAYIDAMMTGFQAVVDAVNNKDLAVKIGDSVIGKAAERYQNKQALVRGV